MFELKEKRKAVRLEEVATILGISTATAKNWVKQKYLKPLKTTHRNPTFEKSQVLKLKEKINSGKINRLDKRANKSNSVQTFIPVEYANDQSTIDLVNHVVKEFTTKILDQECLLFSIVLNLLRKRKLISFHKSLSSISYKNVFIRNEINWWIEQTRKNFSWENYVDFLEIENLSQADDLLGIIYQSTKTEGSKSTGGSYYTPKFIVDEIVNDCVQTDSKVIDPCCGTGRFLISAAKKTANPTQIWGFDIDEIVVRIARINIFLEFPAIECTPNIYCKNTLLEGLSDSNIPSFDLVITNPPWGGRFTKEDKQALRKRFPSIKSGESFSYFIKKSLELLKNDGVLSFVLPEALLNIKTHRDIRQIILEQTKIEKIVLRERVFKNVFTPVFRMDLRKTKAKNSNRFLVQNGKSENKIDQPRFLKNSDFRFDVLNNNLDIALLDKIYDSEHLTLKNNADWALGIVTGNNKKFVKEKENLVTEPILIGKNIAPFIPNRAERHIEYKPEHFQQVAPEYKYRAKEKLIYKFISKKLVFSYDNKQTLTLNSANCLIPKLDYPIKSILALFNSSLYQFLYQKKFGSLKVLRGEIEKLPLPQIEDSQHKDIEFLTDKLLEQNVPGDARDSIYKELNEYIFDLFKLNPQDMNRVKNSIT